ncbi:MAG TPA: FAD-binding oxidoreductase [Burkholderiaceae bacterium]|jgi:D-lactate dehydrogenase (cytochrome)
MSQFLNDCRKSIGTDYVLTNETDIAPYLTDWRQRATGKALAIIKPGSTQEVAIIVRLCNQYHIPIVPQGGNTGLVLGSIPDLQGNAIVLSLTRLNRIRNVDAINNTMMVESGCILQNVQQAAADAARLFPLSLAAEGSCTIGGNLSTNAGGTAVLRYGNARDLCLGLEVVTAQGNIWNGLRGLRKDNTGYDLRDLYIGAEGTLGIITAAVLKLFPQPQAQLTALVAMHTPDDALKLLSLAQDHCGALLTGFELMSDFCLKLVHQHFPAIRMPFPQASAQYVLMELSDNESAEHAATMFEQVITSGLEQGIIHDAVVATSIAQSQALWQLREHIPLAQAQEGKNIKHDISIPISHIGEFISATDHQLHDQFPGCRMVTFGHLGDGNLHYNVSAPEGEQNDAFIARQSDVNRVVHDSVHQFGGSISAEHGLGALKRDEIRRYKSDVEIQLMQSIKHAFDPSNIMNPGKVL